MTWACGDIGQVSLDVYNPMPFELKVFNMVRHICVFLLPTLHVHSSETENKDTHTRYLLLFLGGGSTSVHDDIYVHCTV